MTSAPKPVASDADKRAAIAALNAFRNSNVPGVWPHLDKKAIVDEMRVRLHNPFKVNQGQQPFCGPASVLFELIRKFPLKYVTLCQSLYETGGFQAKTCSIQTSEALRQASQGNLRMGPADWMVLATLRESENVLFPVEPNAPEIVRNLAGMTKFWEMKGWVREILEYPPRRVFSHLRFARLDGLAEVTIGFGPGGALHWAWLLPKTCSVRRSRGSPSLTTGLPWSATSTSKKVRLAAMIAVM